jgi:hypothetical protein
MEERLYSANIAFDSPDLAVERIRPAVRGASPKTTDLVSRRMNDSLTLNIANRETLAVGSNADQLAAVKRVDAGLRLSEPRMRS